MQQIDFLPSRYREQTALRRVKVWRIAVLALCGAGLGVAAMYQVSLREAARRQLAAVASGHAEARAKTEQLAQLQQQLERIQATAELYTYLRHPWPRTQVLAAVAQQIPSEVTLAELRIAVEANQMNQLNPRVRPSRAGEEATQDEQLPAAVRDLQRLRKECDASRTVVDISGLTHDIAALHTYVARLGETPLFARCEISSLEAVGDGKSPGHSRFKLRLTLRPGYGQPGGPNAAKETLALVTPGRPAEGAAP